MRLLFLLLLSTATADPLPREIVPGKAVLEEQPDLDGRQVWNTRFFRIDSDVTLTTNELQRLAQVADTTALAVKAHPLPLFSPPRGKRASISIHADPANYQAAGGNPGSAGYYSARTEAVLIRGEYLVRSLNPGNSRLKARNDEDLLVHEVVHLCMHHVNSRMPQWLLEGVADYFASAHTGAGRFSFADMDKSVRDHLRSRLNPDDPRIQLVPVVDLIGLDGRGWLRYVSGLPVDQRYHAYATSLLLAHYHLHGGATRMEALRKALEARPPRRRITTLIDPESARATQESLARYWKPKGLTLVFPVRE